MRRPAAGLLVLAATVVACSPAPPPEPPGEPRVVESSALESGHGASGQGEAQNAPLAAPRRAHPSLMPTVFEASSRPHDLPLYELVPGDAVVVGAWFVAETKAEGPMVVLVWGRPRDGYLSLGRQALAVWHHSGRDFAGDPWRLGFLFTRPPSYISDFAVHLGDVTGDGHMDVLFFADQGGTAGCGPWRVVSKHGGRVREVLRRHVCEGGIHIAHGRLRIERPVYREDCPGVHGCLDRHLRIIVRWAGRAFETVFRGVVPGAPRPNF